MQTTKSLNVILISLLMSSFPIVFKSIFIPGKIDYASAIIDNLVIKKCPKIANSHRFEGNNLVEKRNYCYIVISMPKRKIYIWSFLRIKHYSTDAFHYMKSNINVKEGQIKSLVFEGGSTLYINEDYLQYNGVKYNIGEYLNYFVEKKYIEPGRFIPLFI
jgi:hypothetical protein